MRRPLFVISLPGERLESIAALLSMRYREKLEQTLPPGQGLIPVLSYREIGGVTLIDVSLTITTSMPDITAIEKAARAALGASGVFLRASGSPKDVVSQASSAFKAAKLHAASLRQNSDRFYVYGSNPTNGKPRQTR